MALFGKLVYYQKNGFDWFSQQYEFYSHRVQFPSWEKGRWGNLEEWGHDDRTFYCRPLQQTAHELFSQICLSKTTCERSLLSYFTDYFDLKALREWRGNESTVYFMPEAYHLDLGDKLLFMPKVFSSVCKEWRMHLIMSSRFLSRDSWRRRSMSQLSRIEIENK